MVIGVCAKETCACTDFVFAESTSHAAAYNGIGNPSSAKDDTVSDVGFCEKAFPDDLHESGTDGKYFLRRSGERRWAAADLLRECRKESGV